MEHDKDAYKILRADKPETEIQLKVGESLLVIEPAAMHYAVKQVMRARDPINTEFLDRLGAVSAFSTSYTLQTDERIAAHFWARKSGEGKLIIGATAHSEPVVVKIVVIA